MPHIDRLAASAMNFTNGYAAHPVCSPTRAPIMTGKYPARLRLTAHLQGAHRLPYSKVLPPPVRLQLPLEERTIAEGLREEGYQPERANQMRSKLEAWLLSVRAQLPQDNPNYDPRRQMEAGPPMGPVPSK